VAHARAVVRVSARDKDMLRSTIVLSLMVLAFGCAGRTTETESEEPMVLEAEPTVFADAPAATSPDTVLTTDPTPAPTKPSTPTPEAVASPLDAVVGDYRYSGGSTQKNAVKREIEETVGKMSVLARGIARTRLTKANKVPSHVEIANDGDLVTVEIDGKAYTAALGGKSVSVRDQGQRSRLRYQMRGDSLYMILDGQEGDRTNVFTPRKDGMGVTMRVKLSSSKLPQAIVYSLSYRG
jgi:hypothetical protein